MFHGLARRRSLDVSEVLDLDSAFDCAEVEAVSWFSVDVFDSWNSRVW